MEVPHPGLQGRLSTHFQRWGESMQCSFLFLCCLHPLQTQFFMAPGNGFNWNSDCNVCRLTARLAAAEKALHAEKGWSLLPGSSSRGYCTWAGRRLEAPCPSAEQGKKQRQKERKQSGRSEEKHQQTTRPNGWLPASVRICYSLKYSRSPFPKAAHQGRRVTQSQRPGEQQPIRPGMQLCNSPWDRPSCVTAEPGLPAARERSQGSQVCVWLTCDTATGVLQDQLLGSTSTTKNVMELPTLQHPTFLP